MMTLPLPELSEPRVILKQEGFGFFGCDYCLLLTPCIVLELDEMGHAMAFLKSMNQPVHSTQCTRFPPLSSTCTDYVCLCVL